MVLSVANYRLTEQFIGIDEISRAWIINYPRPAFFRVPGALDEYLHLACFYSRFWFDVRTAKKAAFQSSLCYLFRKWRGHTVLKLQKMRTTSRQKWLLFTERVCSSRMDRCLCRLLLNTVSTCLKNSSRSYKDLRTYASMVRGAASSESNVSILPHPCSTGKVLYFLHSLRKMFWRRNQPRVCGALSSMRP